MPRDEFANGEAVVMVILAPACSESASLFVKYVHDNNARRHVRGRKATGHTLDDTWPELGQRKQPKTTETYPDANLRVDLNMVKFSGFSRNFRMLVGGLGS